MKVAFRVDSSLTIGTGHVMRCLTLAEALRSTDAECLFICRDHAGNLCTEVKRRGFEFRILPEAGVPVRSSNESTDWLGCDWTSDAEQSAQALDGEVVDWLVVDHYGIDHRWERELRPYCRQMMVIDDLANRPHHADLLLDQNLGRYSSDYAGRVPERTELLIGPKYALLRPDFAKLREYSVRRRQSSGLENLLISMGGVDQPNATGAVLAALKRCPLPDNCRITVVMGAEAPWIDKVRRLAADLPWQTRVRVNVRDMAQMLADSDLAIGAAGSTSWERCCLGVPTLMVVIACNQIAVARALSQANAAILISSVDEVPQNLPLKLAGLSTGTAMAATSAAAAMICDGRGTGRVIERMRANGA